MKNCLMAAAAVAILIDSATMAVASDRRTWDYVPEAPAVFYGTPETDDVIVQAHCGKRKGEIEFEFPYAYEPYSREEIYGLANRWNQVAIMFHKGQQEMGLSGDAMPYTEYDGPGGWYLTVTVEKKNPVFKFFSSGGTIRAEGHKTTFEFPATAGKSLDALRKACR